MNNTDFDPNGIGIKNGNYFGYPYNIQESDLVLISIPWDVTTSYSAGTSNAPEAIIEASTQLDFFDFDIEEAWKLKVGTLPIDEELKTRNIALREKASSIIKALEQGIDINTPDLIQRTNEINQSSEELNNYIHRECNKILDKGKSVGLVGGDHSVPLGLIRALSERHESFGILHIDAHADLRDAYEGFQYSHASIMRNALNCKSVDKLVQVGIRDVCQEEISFAEENSKITMFDDYSINNKLYEGINWSIQCQQIIDQLPDKVYISFDIDGLSPDNCPNTGTPVPGGLTFNQAIYLLRTLYFSGKTIIGFDLCEVCPSSNSNDEWDANVGARILFKLCNILLQNK
ncbi:MAG: agmatinase family protein [Hyphomicrobiales bacterium]